MFDKRKLKANIKSLIIMFVLLIFFFIVDSLVSYQEKKESSLNDKDIDVKKLVINEIMTSNKGAYADSEGKSYDWIELYNGTSHDIDLSGYGLSDDDGGSTKWIFPNVTIPSKEYMIVYLSGTNKEGLYANFALTKEGGETITLKKPSGKVVDSVKTESLKKNTVMARDSNGKWMITSDITPGYDNNQDGREKYLSSMEVKDDVLKLTEFLPVNKGNNPVDGKLYGYIEVKNTSNDEVNLKEYYVSGDVNRPWQWQMPDVTLSAGESYVVYTSELDKDNHTSFTLNKKNGTVILSHKNNIVERVTYEELSNGFAYVKVNDKWNVTTQISPGYDNTSDGMKKYQSSKKNPSDLIISEAMNSNNKYLAQNGNQYYDWIELYNNTDETIKLSDYTLTTSVDNKTMYKLPNVELKAHSYYVIMASGDEKYSNSSYKHANFKLSQAEGLYLYKDDKLIDSIFIANVPKGYSYGRGTGSGTYYFATPTPNKANSTGVSEIAYTPEFSKAPGVYNDVARLEIALQGSGTIYYTLDGSEPTNKSKVYDSPIILKKTTVIRAIAYESGKKKSDIVTGTYFINENHTLPVLSLSLAPSNYKSLIARLNSTTYIVPAHAELYEKDSSFSIDCGMKLFGGQTRFIPKKSFALRFSSEFGPSKLEYKVFDNRDIYEFDKLVVRSGSQDSNATIFRDELATSIMNDYGTVDVQAYKAVVLYINGQYWGIYYLREKVDANFVSTHYNVDPQGTNIIRIDNNITTGSSKFYTSLVSYIKTHDMTTDAAYEYVNSKLDVDNFFDYWIGELWTANNDIVNTRFFNNPNVDNGKIKMIFYDFDYAFWNTNRDYMAWMTNPSGMGEHHFNNTILRGLLQNKKFRKQFLERASYNLKNVWTDEHILKRYQELHDLIAPEIPRNQARWNKKVSTWENDCKVLKSFLTNRRKYVLSSIKKYFNLSSEEMKKYFG